MAKIFIKETHPAYQALKELGCDVHPIEEAGVNALQLGFINLMPTPLDPVRDFAAACSGAKNDIAIYDFAPDPETTSNKTRREYRAAHCEQISDIPKFDLDRIILTGHGVENTAFENLPFWEDLTGALDYIHQDKIPLLASCFGSHAALYRYHQVEKTWDMDNKISGHFIQKVANSAHQLMHGMEAAFLMPVSRYGRSDDAQIRNNPNLKVLAESEETGISIAADDHVTYVTGHPEYPLNSVADEYGRDLKNDTPHLRIPKNVFVDDKPAKGLLQNGWGHARKTFFANWIDNSAVQTGFVKKQIASTQIPGIESCQLGR